MPRTHSSSREKGWLLSPGPCMFMDIYNKELPRAGLDTMETGIPRSGRQLLNKYVSVTVFCSDKY